MTETKCFRAAFRDQLHELSRQPNMYHFLVDFPRLNAVTKKDAYTQLPAEA